MSPNLRSLVPTTVSLCDAEKDNDPKHISRLCKGYLTKKESDGVLRQMTWPPQSPDLNPIEMVWDSSDGWYWNYPTTPDGHHSDVPVPSITVFRKMGDGEHVIVMCSFGRRLIESSFQLSLTSEYNSALMNPQCFSNNVCVFDVNLKGKTKGSPVMGSELGHIVHLRKRPKAKANVSKGFLTDY
ncbi:hypothetical protein ROHU_025698 [Labeo rohita]|uniref:Uncharacterized protein n=1 Tax=Labeo rohita TaxID=84645 RepID=A0A498ML04_LABRO|nr:hypothetical protein ROHU_025698 [Labeo rohita]